MKGHIIDYWTHNRVKFFLKKYFNLYAFEFPDRTFVLFTECRPFIKNFIQLCDGQSN